MISMEDLVKNFPEQLAEAILIGKAAKLQTPLTKLQSVLITGLGGSGIGGTIVSEVVASKCPVPIVVNKDYFLPAFVNEKTLVIVCSYSGNTEETLQALGEALTRKAKIVCITSGGKVEEIAKANSCDVILIPGGNPPRASIGYSLTQLFFVLNFFGFIDEGFKHQLDLTIGLLKDEQHSIKEEAMEVADLLFGTIPVIYAVDGYNGVATRFRQQINENSKMLCWHHVLPEMNHNELVGWAGGSDQLAVVLLRNETDYMRSQKRIEISKDIFSKQASSITEIWSKGNSQLERSIYLIHLTDWVSCFLADKKGIDATEVNVINRLKGELAKI